MSEQQQNSTHAGTAILLLAALALLLGPMLGGGCVPRFAGLEFSSWIGKVTVKPVAPKPVVEPPPTRCLIFGSSTCGHCRELHKTINRELKPLGWTVGQPPADIEEIDIYSNDVRVSRYRHGPSYPTLIIIDQHGKELKREEGAMKGPDLIAWIQSTRK